MDLLELQRLEREIKGILSETIQNLVRYCKVNSVDRNIKEKMIKNTNEICLNSLRMINEQKAKMLKGVEEDR